jgi:hypothetical protein
LFAGTWKVIAIKTASGQQASCPASLHLAGPGDPTIECGPDDEITLNADGTITNSGGQSFSVSGNRMVIHVPADGSDAAYSDTYLVTLVGNVLTLKLISSTDPFFGSTLNGTTTISKRQ